MGGGLSPLAELDVPTTNQQLIKNYCSYHIHYFIHFFLSFFFTRMGLNANQTIFVVIFSLLAVIIILLTYVCWLRRVKMRTKQKILEQQHQSDRQQQQIAYNALSSSQLQELKPVLLQKLYGNDIHTAAPAYTNPFEDTPQYTPPSNDEHILVNINDESERDATIIHTTTTTTTARN